MCVAFDTAAQTPGAMATEYSELLCYLEADEK